jgi:hypothetical protein
MKKDTKAPPIFFLSKKWANGLFAAGISSAVSMGSSGATVCTGTCGAGCGFGCIGLATAGLAIVAFKCRKTG